MRKDGMDRDVFYKSPIQQQEAGEEAHSTRQSRFSLFDGEDILASPVSQHFTL